ncbi:hypothetical protein A616_17390 [Brevibacillus brevis X23]|nr:hypothetical protein A616_17390 [Brevibacillus brevis X23]
MKAGRYGSRAILNPTFIDYATGKPFMHMDYANTASQETTADVVYATGGDGAPRRISFFGSKQSTLTFETQIFTMKHLAMFAGRDIEKGVRSIFKREVVPVVDKSGTLTITLQKTPVNLTSMTVLLFENGVATEEIVPTAIKTKDVELTTGTVVAGDEVEVFYRFETTTEAQRLSITSGDFPKYIQIIGDTVYADEVNTGIVSGQLTYFKARLQPNFTLNFSPTGDPTSLSMVFDIFPQKVLVDGSYKDTLYDIVLYDE